VPLSASEREAAVPDVLDVPVPFGARSLVVSALHLTPDVTPASARAGTELARVIDAWTGPGVVVFNGGALDLVWPGMAEGGGAARAAACLAPHGDLVDAVARFARGPRRRVVYLPGASDGEVASDPAVEAVVRAALGAEVALAAELVVHTEAGPRRVRVDPGHRLNPITRPTDDLGPFPRGNGSRHAWWFVLPLVPALSVGLPLAVLRLTRGGVASPGGILPAIGLTAAAVVLVAVIAAVLVRRRVRAVAGADPNAAPRAWAQDLVTNGTAGLVTGHTRHAELARVGPGFYANSGGAGDVVSKVPSRLSSLGMPPLFLVRRQLSWVELEAGNDLHVRLLHACQDLPGAGAVERLLARPADTGQSGGGGLRPAVVASYPYGASWPATVEQATRLRRVRRWSASLVAVAGVTSILSAFSPPIRGRLEVLLQLIPLEVPQAANTLVALGGLALLFLARGIRRGQRRAWVICAALLAATAVLHLVKGFDVEDALVATGVALYLLVHRDAFAATADQPSTRLGLLTLLGGGACAVLAGTIGAEVGTRMSRRTHHRRLPLPRAFMAAAGRLAGIHAVRLPDRLDDFFTPAMLAVGVALVLAGAYLCFRPVVSGRAGSGSAGGMARAREVVRRYGAGTLDYFALRSDKEFFFWGRSLVAYAVYGGVCLISPDPIGPVTEREETLRAFRRFADGRGWAVAVLGAGEDWLPLYRASGLHDLYVGDEAVVDCSRFTLEGGRHKGLRQAVNRIARHGYTVSFHDPGRLDPRTRAQLEAVMTRSRRGDAERGFSMTLGRAFDPSDDGLLLAVVRGSEGEPVAFIQYVPAPGIDGYSLDLMRRDNGDHPNGLIDFAIVGTIAHLRDQGRQRLGLNFATMRAVLAGEAGEGRSQRLQAWLLRRMSDSMQIESLWKFTAKYDPEWQPRYALYDSPEHALPAAIAVARAESFWELPVVGRFLGPGADRSDAAVAAGVGAGAGPRSDP
jgi:lysylphosphatidylglycerol synthetase-like protein (DUF2156 family)